MNMWKSTKVNTTFLFWGHAFWKECIEDREKIIGIKHFKLLSKENNGQFAENKGNDASENLAQKSHSKG